MWGVFRVENAHVNKKDRFRKYQYVPILSDAEQLQDRQGAHGFDSGLLIELGSIIMVVVLVICIVVIT